MNFSQALDAVVSGKVARRADWPLSNFIFLVPGSEIMVNRAPLNTVLANGTVVNYSPHIDIHEGRNRIRVWTVDQDSILADDWVVMERHAVNSSVETITASDVGEIKDPGILFPDRSRT